MTLTDENGNSTRTCRLFGNKVGRIIDFDGNLKEFSGKPVVMMVELIDAEIFSFKFSKNKNIYTAEYLREIQSEEDLKYRLT